MGQITVVDASIRYTIDFISRLRRIVELFEVPAV